MVFGGAATSRIYISNKAAIRFDICFSSADNRSNRECELSISALEGHHFAGHISQLDDAAAVTFKQSRSSKRVTFGKQNERTKEKQKKKHQKIGKRAATTERMIQLLD